MRLIDADIFNSFDYSSFDGALTEDAVQGMDTVLNAIDIAPTIDVEPVRHGEWEEIEIQLTWCEDDVDIIYKCSVCRENNIGKSNYCPNCGAKMNGERKEN